jgi:hypothetical protein
VKFGLEVWFGSLLRELKALQERLVEWDCVVLWVFLARLVFLVLMVKRVARYGHNLLITYYSCVMPSGNALQTYFL